MKLNKKVFDLNCWKHDENALNTHWLLLALSVVINVDMLMVFIEAGGIFGIAQTSLSVNFAIAIPSHVSVCANFATWISLFGALRNANAFSWILIRFAYHTLIQKHKQLINYLYLISFTCGTVDFGARINWKIKYTLNVFITDIFVDLKECIIFWTYQPFELHHLLHSFWFRW